MKNFYIKTFGCIQNQADSDQIIQNLTQLGLVQTDNINEADMIIINSCIVRESAENRVYGLIENIRKFSINNDKKIDVVVTGCLTGWTTTNKLKKRSLLTNFADIEFKKIEDFDIWREKTTVIGEKLIVPISFGCNNFCSYCAVPFCRGKEISRAFDTILADCQKGIDGGISEVLLVGQNVNSYGSDLNDTRFKPVMVKSMGKNRIPSLFPHLLSKVSQLKFEKISFVSSNPWDFSDELINVIFKHKNIDRLIHLPIQAGDDEILRKMNRGYTVDEYIFLINKIRSIIKDAKISTDIIIGFPGETDSVFEKSYRVYKKIGFEIAYLNKYSSRSGTLASKLFKDNISADIKKQRWLRLNKLINNKLS